MVCKYIEIENIFGDPYNAVTISEYTEELSLLKKMIMISENVVASKVPGNIWSFDGICYLFARTIVSYAKMAYDNMILGYFDAAYMFIRVIIENRVCLELIRDDETQELWKNYIVYSYKNAFNSSGRKLTESEIDLLKKYV